jgi:hypothetical protein
MRTSFQVLAHRKFRWLAPDPATRRPGDGPWLPTHRANGFAPAILEEKSIKRLFFARLCRRDGGQSANATPTLHGQR